MSADLAFAAYVQGVQDSLGLQVSIDEAETLLCKWYTVTGPDGQRLAHIEADRPWPDAPWRPARVWASFQAINAEDAWTMRQLAAHVVDVAGRFEKVRTDQGQYGDPTWAARRFHGVDVMVGDILVVKHKDVAHVVTLPLASRLITSTGMEFSTEWPRLRGMGCLFPVGADRLDESVTARAYRMKAPTE